VCVTSAPSVNETWQVLDTLIGHLSKELMKDDRWLDQRNVTGMGPPLQSDDTELRRKAGPPLDNRDQADTG
jgi:hypothetical protein